MYTNIFTVPDFYEDFKCKCGKCRKPCCYGWEVTLSMKEYFSLLGLECSDALRTKMDSALLLERRSSEERYAFINKNWSGDCALRRTDGYCMLQCERGEEVLPAVCRYYPRSPKTDRGYECTLSNSCEGVAELLYRHKREITFVQKQLTFDLQESEKKEEKEDESAIRNICLILMQEEKPLKEKLYRLGGFLREYDTSSDKQAVLEKYSSGSVRRRDKGVQACEGDSLLDLQLAFLREFVLFSPDMKPYCEHTLARIQTREEYGEFERNLYEKFSKTDRFLSNLLVNNMFFKRFPFGDEGHSLEEEFVALCATYAFLKIILVGCEDTFSDERALIDAAADCFRLINHTRFEHNAVVIANRMNFPASKIFYSLMNF